MSSKIVWIVVAVAVLLVVAAALLLPSQFSKPPTTERPKGNIYLIYDIGGRGDLSFNDMAYLGASRAAADFKLGLKEVQSRTQDDYVPNLRASVRSGDATISIAVGFLMTDAVKQVSQEFLNAKFAIIDGYIPDKSNVMSVLYRQNEGFALVGALAALVAYYYNCSNVGIVLGVEIPVCGSLK